MNADETAAGASSASAPAPVRRRLCPRAGCAFPAFRALALVLVLAPGGPTDASSPAVAPGLAVRPDGVLVKDGKPYRAIGVNYFDAFYRVLLDEKDTTYDAGFAALAARKIPFARFMCGGFWPAENRLYLRDPNEYFRRLDGVIRSAERHSVGLIPSLFWHISTVPDIVGEPCDRWGDAASRTQQFMRTYTRQVVTRYRDSPAVWGWEFGNEYNLAADLPNAAEHRPPAHPRLGTPATRTARDELTSDMVRAALAEFAREVRRHDARRIISSGNSFPRPSAWHQRLERSWTADSPDQRAEMLLGDNPDPVNTLSVRAYQDNLGRIGEAMAVAAKARKPLFVGEFGIPGETSEQTRRQFQEMLKAIEAHGVPLAALWVYDRGRDDPFSVTPDGPRAWQLDAIAQANARLRAE